jgi:hypothetical protein
MYEDPIMTEVRSAGQLLAEEAGGDLHLFFQRLREAQKQYPDMMKLSDIPAKFYSPIRSIAKDHGFDDVDTFLSLEATINMISCENAGMPHMDEEDRHKLFFVYLIDEHNHEVEKLIKGDNIYKFFSDDSVLVEQGSTYSVYEAFEVFCDALDLDDPSSPHAELIRFWQDKMGAF